MELIMIALLILAIACVFILLKRSGKKEVYCYYCHKTYPLKDEHWCKDRLEYLKEKQKGRMWDGKSRRVLVRYYCRKCMEVIKEYTIFDYVGQSEDEIIFIASVCHEHEGK